MVKNLLANAGDTGDPGLIPRLGRSPGEGNGNPLQYSCLGNPMDGRAWWATVHGLASVRQNLETKPPPPPSKRILFSPLKFSACPLPALPFHR